MPYGKIHNEIKHYLEEIFHYNKISYKLRTNSEYLIAIWAHITSHTYSFRPASMYACLQSDFKLLRKVQIFGFKFGHYLSCMARLKYTYIVWYTIHFRFFFSFSVLNINKIYNRSYRKRIKWWRFSLMYLQYTIDIYIHN